MTAVEPAVIEPASAGPATIEPAGDEPAGAQPARGGLRRLIEGLPWDWKPRRFAFPLSCETEEARFNVENRLGILSAPPLSIDMPELRALLVVASETGDWSVISERNWRYASECLSFGDSPLIANDRFIDAYLAHCAEADSAAIINGLIRFYLWHFDPAPSGFRRIAEFLAERAADGWSRWSDLHRRYRLFDASQAPARLAEAVMTVDKAPRDFLAGIGLSGSLAAARLLGTAFVAACEAMIAATDHGHPPLPGSAQRLILWAFKGSEFLYAGVPRARPVLAEALLRPWSEASPPAETRDLIKRVLLGLLKEPRTNPVAWVDVSEQAQRVICHWLAKVSLEQFLEVVDETVQVHHTRIWTSRRKFWTAYHDKGYMQEAWVVFGRRGAAIARQAAGTRDRADIISFGTFLGDATGDQRQAVLIMKIGSLVVADWSHNGCCHVWLPGNLNAPGLFQREYYRSDLAKGSDLEQPHVKHWQSAIHDFIRATTGFWIPSGDYL